MQRIDRDFCRFVVVVKGNVGEWDNHAACLHSGAGLTGTCWGYLRYDAMHDAPIKPNNSPPLGTSQADCNAATTSKHSVPSRTRSAKLLRQIR